MSGAIIIGAGPGIGMSVARRVAREGLSVGVIARSQATVDRVLSTLGGVDALGVAADVTDEAALRAALDRIIDRIGVPELLVYNAALIMSDGFGELTAAQHLDAWAVDVVGAITAAAHVAPRMAHLGAGTIVITGGMPEPVPQATSLSLGKAGVRALTELLAKAYGAAGVHVATVTVGGAVAPGTAFDPDDIAELYWTLHTQPVEAWQREVLYAGQVPTGGIADSAFARPQASVQAQLSVRDGRAAVDFYKTAFGAVEVFRFGGTDELAEVVAQLEVGNSLFWVEDESPSHGNFSPATVGGATTRMLLVVDDPERVQARAVAAGAAEVHPVGEEHGWLLGRIDDPFGHRWEIGRPLTNQ